MHIQAMNRYQPSRVRPLSTPDRGVGAGFWLCADADLPRAYFPCMPILFVVRVCIDARRLFPLDLGSAGRVVVLSSVSAKLYELVEKSVVVDGDAHHCAIGIVARSLGCTRAQLSGYTWIARELPSSVNEHCSWAEPLCGYRLSGRHREHLRLPKHRQGSPASHILR